MQWLAKTLLRTQTNVIAFQLNQTAINNEAENKLTKRRGTPITPALYPEAPDSNLC